MATKYLYTYPTGDVDQVELLSVVGLITDDATATVRLPNGDIRTVLTLDLVGLDGSPDAHTDPSDDQVTYTVQTLLLNDFRDSSPRSSPFARRVQGPTLTFRRTAGDVAEVIAEAAWAVGNRMARDDNGQAWPANVRSLSMGDAVVVKVGEPGTTVGLGTGLIARMAGFRRFAGVGTTVMVGSAVPRQEQGIYGPWRDASDVVEPGQTEDEWAAAYEAQA